MAELDDAVAKATAEANEIFGKLAATVEGRVKEKATSLDVAEIARKAGLEIDERMLEELRWTV